MQSKRKRFFKSESNSRENPGSVIDVDAMEDDKNNNDNDNNNINAVEEGEGGGQREREGGSKETVEEVVDR
jgi:hypothetical protein